MTAQAAPINVEVAAEKGINVVVTSEGDEIKKQNFGAERRNLTVDPSDPKKSILRNVRGIVKWFSIFDHYGFINRHDTGEDVFVHVSALVEKGRLRFALETDQEVEFDVAHGIKGPKAVAVSLPGGFPIESNRFLRFGRRRMLDRRRASSVRGGNTTDAENNGKQQGRERGNGSSGDAKRNRTGGRRNRDQDETTDAEAEPQKRETAGDSKRKNRKPKKNRFRRRRPTVSKSEAGEENGDGEQQDAELKKAIEKEPGAEANKTAPAVKINVNLAAGNKSADTEQQEATGDQKEAATSEQKEDDETKTAIEPNVEDTKKE